MATDDGWQLLRQERGERRASVGPHSRMSRSRPHAKRDASLHAAGCMPSGMQGREATRRQREDVIVEQAAARPGQKSASTGTGTTVASGVIEFALCRGRGIRSLGAIMDVVVLMLIL